MKRTFKQAVFAVLVILAAAVVSYGLSLENMDRRFEEITDYQKGVVRDYSTPLKTYEDPVPFPVNEILYDMTGKKQTLAAYKGRYVLVNFWATWCPPCITELPSLRELQEKRGGDDFEVVFISMDFPETPDDLRSKMVAAGISDIETLYSTEEKIWESIELKGLPTSFLVDPNGRILYAVSGEINWVDSKVMEFLDGVIGA